MEASRHCPRKMGWPFFTSPNLISRNLKELGQFSVEFAVFLAARASHGVQGLVWCAGVKDLRETLNMVRSLGF